jgi:carboxyl-terminal processing protease
MIKIINRIFSLPPMKLIPLFAVMSLLPNFSMAKVVDAPNSQSAVFNNLPRVALLMKEQYVDPERIDTGAMLAAILESLESYISRLVVTLPKSLEQALEKSKKGEEFAMLEAQASASSSSAPPPPAGTDNSKPKPTVPVAPLVKEKLSLDLGGVKKVFDYEPQKSIWGMIFMLRDIFKFVEAEAKKQGLAVKSKAKDEPIDWEKIENGAINAMLGTLDPHSVFLKPEYARDLTLTTKGEFGGVGIVISIRDGFLTVISPIDGTPAAIAGVKAKDRIVKIDEDSAINMPLEDAVSKLRGAPKSNVKISVQRGNSTKELDFTLKRDIIKVDSVAYALLDNNVGYLRIKAFQGNTADDVKSAILKMKGDSKEKMKGVILDLRDNPGGLLREAVAISDLFLSSGEIVSTQGALKESRQVEMATPGELDKNMKIAVLINGGSASASEIVAAALQYGGAEGDDPNGGRAILIGDSPTFGKGSVQMLFDFPSLKDGKATKDKPIEPAALKLTIAQYYAPQDKIIQTIGVTPDIRISEINANKAEELSLFQNTSMREIDLEAHLSAAKKREEKSLMQIEFLAPPPSEEGAEYSKINAAKLKQEFPIIVASEFITSAKGPKRSELLAEAESIKARLDKQEQKKIIDALKKYNIDWSIGNKLSAAKALKTSIIANPGAKAGEKLKVTVKVKNLGKVPAYQVHALTHSKTPLFDQKEFLFGKLNPGQEIERTVEFEIPKDVITRKDLLSLEIRDIAKEKLDELNLPIVINGLGRPRFSHLVFIDDAKSGNGDGKVQNGEDVELVVWLKNIGEGKAFEPTVLLRNESGAKVFLKTGRVQLGEMLPNQEGSVRFSFRVKEPSESADFEIQVFDGQMHDIWRDKISLDVAHKEKTTGKKASLVLSSKTASLLAKANDKAQVLATLKEGLRCESLGELNGYYLVNVDENLVGFVKKSDLKIYNSKTKEVPQKKSDFFTINFDRIPAKIGLKFAEGNGWTKQANGVVSANILSSGKVSELLLYVNMKKVFYKSLSTSSQEEKINQDIVLKPGINIISLIAREDAIYGQRENITVFYDDVGRVLALPEKGGTGQAKVNAPVSDQ